MRPEGESLLHPRLWLAFGAMLFVSGIPNTFPVFFPPLLAEFGGSRAATAFTASLLWMGGAALGPVAGFLVDRGNPRLLVAGGLAVTALGLVGAPLAPSLPVFVATLGLLGGIGIGLTGMATQAAVIADAYQRRRGFATGIAFAGSMAGYVLSAPLHEAIVTVGWRSTLAGYALLVVALIPGVLRVYPSRLGSPRPSAATARAPVSLAVILRSPSFWCLSIVAAISPLVGIMATLQHALYFETLGFPAAEAAAMLTVGGILATGGRALAGLAADRFGPVPTSFVSYGLSLAGTLCLLAVGVWPWRILAYGYVLLVFLPLGTRATIIALLVGQSVSPARFGTVFGVLTAGSGLGAALGPFLSGALYDLTGSYRWIYIATVALIAVALGALVTFVRTAPRDR